MLTCVNKQYDQQHAITWKRCVMILSDESLTSWARERSKIEALKRLLALGALWSPGPTPTESYWSVMSLDGHTFKFGGWRVVCLEWMAGFTSADHLVRVAFEHAPLTPSRPHSRIKCQIRTHGEESEKIKSIRTTVTQRASHRGPIMVDATELSGWGSNV